MSSLHTRIELDPRYNRGILERFGYQEADTQEFLAPRASYSRRINEGRYGVIVGLCFTLVVSLLYGIGCLGASEALSMTLFGAAVALVGGLVGDFPQETEYHHESESL